MLSEFKNPSNEYRSIPFWSWNCRVTKELIDEDLDHFARMGFGGVCIHPRAGLDIPYLGDAYMNLIAYAVQGCEKRNLVCWIYDDDRFPSGAADGLVTKDERYRGKYLLLSEEQKENHLAAWALEFSDGVLISHRRLTSDTEIGAAMEVRDENHRVRFGYLALLPNQPWFEGCSYIDTTDPQAVRAFLDVTHARYYNRLGSQFGKTIQAVFTDEPRMEPRLQGKLQITEPMTHDSFAVPYTVTFARYFSEAYGMDPLDAVPCFVWDCPDADAPMLRRKYREALSECFTRAFLDQEAAWCREHGVRFTGHILGEDSLASQTRTVGDAMRCYRNMDLPGLDVLVDGQNWLAALQAASVAETMGKAGVMSELYGATDWDCSFLTYKLQGDWQEALGITYRVPHLCHMSLEGEAKRDWPGSIFTQSPWHERYKLIEDHFARLNLILRRGRRLTRVAVIHPVEAVWEQPMCGGNGEQHSQQFDAMIQRILTNLIDVRLISEALLESGAMTLAEFEAVVVPDPETIRPSTAEQLADFGGCVLGPDSLGALEKYRDLRVICHTPGTQPELLYQLRQDGARKWLFLCHTGKNAHDTREENEIVLRGTYAVRLWDTQTGEVQDLPAQVYAGMTHVFWRAYRDESLLLELSEAGNMPGLGARRISLTEPDSVCLAEPNALLLDFARYSLDGEALSEPAEILKLDNQIRDRLGLLPRCENMRQPWAMEPGKAHKLTLVYEFTSEISLDELTLVAERPGEQEILLNDLPGKPVKGYFIDRAFQMVRLPNPRRGTNKLIIHRDFTEKTNLEPMFLLGSFSVTDNRISAPRAIRLGDITAQGLPHYTGNITYSFRFDLDAPGAYALHIPKFVSPLIDASLDGGEALPILTTRPVSLGKITAGPHVLTLTVCGSRYNLLSALHHADPAHYWHGPDSWRTTGENWTDGYMTKPAGLLAPVELIREG